MRKIFLIDKRVYIRMDSGDKKSHLTIEILDTLRFEGLCLETELKLRMEGKGFYEDFTGRKLIELAQQGLIKKGEFNLFPDQRKPSRYYYDKNLPLNDQKRLLNEKSYLYRKAMDIHSNRAYSADYLEVLIFLSLVKVKLTHPPLQIKIHRPHDYVNWINGHKYAFDDFFTIATGNYGVQIRNSIHMFSPTTSDIQDFLEMAKKRIARPILISRMSSKDLKRFLLRQMGRAFDLKKSVICVENNPNFERKPFQELGITHIIQEVPHLIQIGGERLNGTEFFQTQKYEHYTFEELEKAADINVPLRIIKKTTGLIRLLYISTLIDIASQMITNKRESMIGAILTSASYNYILNSKGKKVYIDTLYTYSKPKIRPPLMFQLQKLGDKRSKHLLILNLRNLVEKGLLEEPSRYEFRVTDAQHPEEWLRY